MLIDTLIALAFVFLMLFLWLAYTRAFGAEFVRTSKHKRAIALKMLELNKKDIFYDLGAGFGSMLIEASPKVKKAIGIEIDPIRFLIAYLRIKIKKIKNAKIIFGNLFNVPLNDSTKIFAFLSKEANEKLGEKINKEFKREKIIIVSYKWPIKNINLAEVNERLYKHKL